MSHARMTAWRKTGRMIEFPCRGCASGILITQACGCVTSRAGYLSDPEHAPDLFKIAQQFCAECAARSNHSFMGSR